MADQQEFNTYPRRTHDISSYLTGLPQISPSDLNRGSTHWTIIKSHRLNGNPS